MCNGSHPNTSESSVVNWVMGRCIASHEIEPNLLASDNWGAYIKDHREKPRQLIKKLYGGNVAPFSDEMDQEESAGTQAMRGTT